MKKLITVASLACALPAFGQFWYAGNTTFTDVPYPPTPPAPSARNQGNAVDPYLDTTLVPSGVKWVRLTDENFTPGSPCGMAVGQSWQNADDPSNIGWNSDGTMFFAHNSGNNGVVWILNRATGDTTLAPPHNLNDTRCGMLFFSGNNYNIRLPWAWSSLQRSVIFGVANADNSFRYLDVLNPGSTSTVLVSFNGLVNCNQHMTEYTHDLNDRIHIAVCGGGGDTDPYVVYYDSVTGQRHYLSGVTNTIDGQAYAPDSDLIPAPGFFHQAQISTNGDYIMLAKSNNGSPGAIFLWQLSTGLVKKVTYNGIGASGHRAMGTSITLFDDFCPPLSDALIQFAKVPFGAVSTCSAILSAGPPRVSLDMHFSWQTRTALFPLAPIFAESYDKSGGSSDAAFTREIFMIDPLNNRVVRIAKSWCIGPESEFFNQCGGQIDPTGTWALVKSNWNKTLTSARMDVFLLGPLPKLRDRTSGRGSGR